MKLEFKYFGESTEAIFDRLPTAEIISEDNGVYTFKAEVFGRGIKPWILSQVDKIEVLKPLDFREEVIEAINKIGKLYE